MATLIKDTITYYRSTSYSFEVTVEPPEGMSTTDIFFTVKADTHSSDATDNDALIKKDVTPVSNVGTIEIDPGDVPDSTEPGTYFYSIHVKFSDGNIYPFASGKFKLVATTTNRES